MRHVERRGSIILHSSTPYHCVCNDTHLSRGCWCGPALGPHKQRRPYGRLARLRDRLIGGGRA